MSKKSKFCISILKNGVVIGFVKSINYTTGNFVMIADKSKAMGCDTTDEVFSAIDIITTPQLIANGVTFSLDKKISQQDEIYEQKALSYAEKYGIIEYTVKKNYMIYIASYPKYLDNKAYSVKFTVNLDTGEVSKEVLNRFYRKGLVNR